MAAPGSSREVFDVRSVAAAVPADVEDLDAARETLLAAGATERDAPRQVAPGARICVLADPDGNPIGLRGK